MNSDYVLLEKLNTSGDWPFIDEEYEYWSGHRPYSIRNKNQTIDGVIINPHLPKLFEARAHNKRPKAEIEDWWGRAFIKTIVNIETAKNDVFLIYEVRCLDGSVSSKSTLLKQFINLNLAINYAKRFKIKTADFEGAGF
ncbi:hypothetical protein GCM10023116_29710 [Kistimonas scapharcae]|uniref:Uncharacterized protein n=1 Tax=Kistimonas scapharcae TaxID=1036133 RepID=A0ABP8V380_9GAMM